MDFFSLIPSLKKIYAKAEKLIGSLDLFMNSEWIFSNDNTVALYNSLSKIDKELFEFNFENLDWDSYFRNYTMGLKVYLLKEPLDTVDQAKKRATFLKILHGFNCSFVIIALYFAVKMLFRGLISLFW